MPKLQIDIIKQRSLTKFFWKQGNRLLLIVQQPVIDLAGEIDIDDLKARVQYLLKPDPIRRYVTDMWVKTGSLFAMDTIKRIHNIKQEENIDFWEDFFRNYINERSLAKTGALMDTQAQIVNNIIDEILKEGYDRGLGIPEIQRTMRENLIEGLTNINKYQAERIARTEVIGASNTGSFEGALETDVVLGKHWLTSGLPGIRKSHLYYESLGRVDMNYEYNIGLRYPGDPNGDADEIINCRCTPTYIVD